jgi:hypothetical protein
MFLFFCLSILYVCFFQVQYIHTYFVFLLAQFSSIMFLLDENASVFDDYYLIY